MNNAKDTQNNKTQYLKIEKENIHIKSEVKYKVA